MNFEKLIFLDLETTGANPAVDRITEIVPPRKGADLAAALEVIRAEFPNVTDFEREFPSLCFALATGVGKTRLMGAFVSYFHLTGRSKNFFVLAPNTTIYDKLVEDFSKQSSPKYVFRGIAEFAQRPLSRHQREIQKRLAVPAVLLSPCRFPTRAQPSPRPSRLQLFQLGQACCLQFFYC
jgi:ADP-heptose:LPS heptosyltransferase